MSELSVERIEKAEANRLLSVWEHPLEGSNRPFGQDFFALLVAGVPLGVTVTASTVSSTLRDEQEQEWPRGQMVELARLARKTPHNARSSADG